MMTAYLERACCRATRSRPSTRAAWASWSASGVERRSGARKPDLKLGVCGEHGGDPASIAFFYEAGLDYVSCSPFRVPIARLAAAQAVLGGEATIPREQLMPSPIARRRPGGRRTSLDFDGPRLGVARAPGRLHRHAAPRRPAGRPPHGPRDHAQGGGDRVAVWIAIGLASRSSSRGRRAPGRPASTSPAT